MIMAFITKYAATNSLYASTKISFVVNYLLVDENNSWFIIVVNNLLFEENYLLIIY